MTSRMIEKIEAVLINEKLNEVLVYIALLMWVIIMYDAALSVMI